MSDDIPRDTRETIGWGAREPRQAEKIRGLATPTTARKPANDTTGGDPYNTSGSFDRKKNWARIGKR